MALFKRQMISYEIFDDQSPSLYDSYVGNWTRFRYAGFNNGTLTGTPTPGASVTFAFSGSQAYLYGGLLNVTSTDGGNISYPSADYKIDGVSAGSQQPYFDTAGGIVYFRTPQLADGIHEIDITVTSANDTNVYFLDFFLVTPTPGGGTSGVDTSRPPPTSTSSTSLPIVTSHSTPVGAIVGGVVGGIALIAILSIAAWYFLRRRSRGGQAYYFDKPTPGDILSGEDHIEPFNAATATTPAPSSAGFNGQGPQSAYSDGSSNQPLNPSFGQSASQPSRYSQPGLSDASGPTHVSGISAQPRVGKAALIAQQYQDVEPPVQYEDSGVRFNPNGETEAGPSQLPHEVPPSYTPQ